MKAIVKTKVFLIGVKAELRKVTWTTRKELMASTVVVVVAVVIIALFLGVVDYVMQEGLISGRYSIIKLFGG
jgi:preprotein translocase subunit SecE